MLAHWPEASPGESFLSQTGLARIDDADAALWSGSRLDARQTTVREVRRGGGFTFLAWGWIVVRGIFDVGCATPPSPDSDRALLPAAGVGGRQRSGGAFQWEFSLSVLAAVLAVLGCSVNESVVVFDRVRETFKKVLALSTPELLDHAITSTISRTIIIHGSA